MIKIKGDIILNPSTIFEEMEMAKLEKNKHKTGSF